MTGSGAASRVLMLVDNRVRGDSRVQKQAASMAERGWDVTLVGISPDRRTHRWTIEGAAVELAPMRRRLSFPAFRQRRGWLRSPLAYRSVAVAEARTQRLRAHEAEVGHRRATGLGAPGPAGRAVAAVRAAWTQRRASATRRLDEQRATTAGWIDRAATVVWSRVLGGWAWRRLEPSLADFTSCHVRTVLRERPDVVHANDVRTLAAAVRAARRLRDRGVTTRVVWDAHEYVVGVDTGTLSPRQRAARVAAERLHVSGADALVTVSDTLGRWLVRDHGLDVQPVTVLNAPVLGAPDPGLGTVRSSCGLRSEVPLLVYVGGLLERRGVATMIEGLPELPDAHVALLCPDLEWSGLETYRELAAGLGVLDRLHLLPYVPYDQVSSYLADADVGVIPLHRTPNHDAALITKFLEYSFARLPIVVSDVEEMARTVRETGQGEVFTARDTDDYVRAVRHVLADTARYRRAYDAEGLLSTWSWDRQADALDTVYRAVLDGRATGRSA